MDTVSRPQIYPLRQIPNPLGDIRHAIKASDPGFAGFGEVYFSTIHEGSIKGWKKHLQMQLNLVVPFGEVCFYVLDDEGKLVGRWQIGLSNYARLTIPPGFWFAFRGQANGTSIVMNLANIEHDPIEAITLPIDSFKLDFIL